METLFKKLQKNNKLPMHMPGHKRKSYPYIAGMADIDITEIEGFDNLHGASGILLKSMKNAADLRGAKAAFYLVNGSTCGILASVCAVLSRGDKAIVARNCHKSVYNAIETAGAEPVFVYPGISGKYGIAGSVAPEAIAKAVSENPDCRLIIITSPTYEGVISDIEGICAIAHKHNIPVLVDAAHGAHLGFGGFSKGAVELGADISVESLHKTLPSLTQTAVCYLSGDIVKEEKIAEKLAVFETSSPSYILLSSIDGCINEMKKESSFKKWNEALDFFYNEAKKLKNIEILGKQTEFFGLDESKIVLFPENQSGTELAGFLRKENIEPEMAAPDYVICMTGAGDTKSSIKKLLAALFKADKIEKSRKIDPITLNFPQNRALSVFEAEKREKVLCDLKNAAGRVSAGYVWAYPPGVPVLVPGEVISEEVLETLSGYKRGGIGLYGDIKDGEIFVVK